MSHLLAEHAKLRVAKREVHAWTRSAVEQLTTLCEAPVKLISAAEYRRLGDELPVANKNAVGG